VKRVSDIILPVIPGSQEVVPVTRTNIIVSLVVNVVMMFILTWLLFRRSRNKQDLSYSLTSLFMFLTAFMYILMSMLLVTVEVNVQKSRNMTYIAVTLISIMMSFLSIYGIMVRHA
jgi:dolichyl-phosphate-mannose--protein O-mannosyl transferase